MMKWVILCLAALPLVVAAQEKGGDENIVRIVVPSDEEWRASQEKLRSYLDKSTHPLDENYLHDQLIKKERLKSLTIAPPWQVDDFVSKTTAAQLEPGSKSVNIELAPGLPVMVTLKTISGKDVNVLSVQHGAAVSVLKTETEKKDVEPMPANVLAIKPEVIRGSGNILVLTDLSTIPLSLGYKIKKPGKKYTDRYSILIDDGSGRVEQKASLPARKQLMRVLSGIPPENASRVFFGQGVSAWETRENRLWLRTEMKLVYPARKITKASLEGVNAYLIPSVPIITLLDGNGRIHQFDREVY